MYTLRIVYDLRSAFQQSGCALCTLGAAGARRYLDYALYARVTEPDFRAEVRAGHGFCAPHAQILAEYHGALGITMLCSDLVADLLDALQHAYDHPGVTGQPHTGTGAWTESLVAQLNPRGMCPACAAVQRADRIGLTGLFSMLPDPNFAATFGAGDGLCLPHLVQALRYPAPPTAITVLLHHQRDIWSRQADNLAADTQPITTTTWRWLLQTFSVGRTGEATLEAFFASPDDLAMDTEVVWAAYNGSPCPLCALTALAEDRYLRRLTDTATEPARRGALSSGSSSCRRHAIPLIASAPVAPVTALYQVSLAECLAQLQQAPPLRQPRFFRRPIAFGQAIADRLDGERVCPACSSIAQYERAQIGMLLDDRVPERAAAAPVFRAGLCLPHLRTVLRQGADPQMLQTLLQQQIPVWQTIGQELAAFARKHDYRYAHEPFGSERDVWLRALQLLSGWHDRSDSPAQASERRGSAPARSS